MLHRIKFRLHASGAPEKFAYNIPSGTSLFLDGSFRPAVGGRANAIYSLVADSQLTVLTPLREGLQRNGNILSEEAVELAPGDLFTAEGITVEVLECPVSSTATDGTVFVDIDTLAGSLSAAEQTRELAAPGAKLSLVPADPALEPPPAPMSTQKDFSEELPDRVVVPLSLDHLTRTDEIAPPFFESFTAATPTSPEPPPPSAPFAPRPFLVPKAPEVEDFTAIAEAKPEAPADPAPAAPAPRKKMRPNFYTSLDEAPMKDRETLLKRSSSVGILFFFLIVGAYQLSSHFQFDLFDDQNAGDFVATLRPVQRAHTPKNFPPTPARAPASVPTPSPIPVAPNAIPSRKPNPAELRTLDNAVDEGDLPTVKSMLESQGLSADFALDELGRSPFLRAAAAGQLQVMQYLLQKRVAINATDMTGTSALMWAVINGRENAVRFLLALGLDPAAKRDDGKNCFALARDYRQNSVAKLLGHPADRQPASK